MSLGLHHEPAAELDELLAFVGDFGLGNGPTAPKPHAPSSTEALAMSDDAWFNELGELLSEETRPPLQHVELDQAAKTLSFAEPALVLKPAKKVSGRARVSRKEELEYLRLKVKEMEGKLQGLKEKSDADRSPPLQPLDNTPNSMHTEHSVALWKSLAERQKTQRELVEVENARLREKLKTQVRMAKSLKRILCKRTRDDELGAKTPKRSRPLLQGVNSSAALFDDMLQCLNELYLETDKHIAQSLKASISNPVVRTRDVKYTDTAGMFIEFQDSKLWPFDMHTVSRAQWRFLTETGHKFNKYIEENVEMRGNTMLRKFGVEIKHGSNVAVLFGRQVSRRYVESDRVVLVRHSIIDEIQLAGSPTGGLTFRESGWIVLKNATDVLGSGDATLVQSHSTMSPDIDLDAQWEIGALTDFVLQSREDVEVGNDAIIENFLIEEATKQTAT